MNDDSRRGGTQPREILYQQVAKHAPRAIEVLVEIMEKGDNSNSRLGAAKTILAKAIPDLGALEVVGKDGQPIFGFLKDFISAGGWNVPTSVGSTQRSDTVQGSSLASESQKNDNGSGEDKPRGT